MYSSFTVIHIFGYMVFFIYVFLYFLMLTHLLGTYCSFQIVILSFHIDYFISKYIYCNVAEIYHTCCVHFFSQAIWWNYLSEITSGVISSLEWLFFTTYYTSHLHTYGCFYICNLFHVLLYQTCILILGGPSGKVVSYWYLIHTGIQFISAQLTIVSGVCGVPSTTICSSDKFCLVVCNSSLLNWPEGLHLPWVYLISSISTTYFMYQCSNIVIHLLLLIDNYIWITIIWYIHTYQNGDKKSNLQLKTHHISVIHK